MERTILASTLFHKLFIFILFLFGLIILPPALAEMTLCDCMNKPMNTDAKVAACTAIFDAQDPKTAHEERLACRDQLPSSGEPDFCYCMKTSTRDENIYKKCQAIFEGISEAQMMKRVRDCAGRSFN